jgi:hypothetical protein
MQLAYHQTSGFTLLLHILGMVVTFTHTLRKMLLLTS